MTGLKILHHRQDDGTFLVLPNLKMTPTCDPKQYLGRARGLGTWALGAGPWFLGPWELGLGGWAFGPDRAQAHLRAQKLILTMTNQ